MSESGKNKSLRLTPEVAKAICDAVRVGCYLQVAAELAGVEYVTFKQWLRKGKAWLQGQYSETKGKPGLGGKNQWRQYGKFVLEIRKAMAEAEFHDLERLNAAGERIWQAAAWKLERRWRRRWTTLRRQENYTEEHVRTENHITVENLPLPLEVKRQVLEAMMQAKKRPLALEAVPLDKTPDKTPPGTAAEETASPSHNPPDTSPPLQLPHNQQPHQ